MTEAEWLACNTPDPLLKWVWDTIDRRQLLRLARRCSQRIRYEPIPPILLDLERIVRGLACGKDHQHNLLIALEAARMEQRLFLPLDLPEYQHFIGAIATFDPFSSVDEYLNGLLHFSTAVAHAAVPYVIFRAGDHGIPSNATWQYVWQLERRKQAGLLRDFVINPFPVTLDPNWLSSDVLAMARAMHKTRDYSAMPILADALQEAGCEQAGMLDHCRDPNGSHVRGCWVVDLLLGKS